MSECIGAAFFRSVKVLCVISSIYWLLLYLWPIAGNIKPPNRCQFNKLFYISKSIQEVLNWWDSNLAALIWWILSTCGCSLSHVRNSVRMWLPRVWLRPFCLPGQHSRIVSTSSRGPDSLENPRWAAKCSYGWKLNVSTYVNIAFVPIKDIFW